MRFAINENTRQDKHLNQIIANFNYDENSMSIFKKKFNKESDKFEINNVPELIWISLEKIRDLLTMRIGNR